MTRNSWSSQTRYYHCSQKLNNPIASNILLVWAQGHSFFTGYPAILEYRAMCGLIFWPRLPWIRQNSFTISYIPYTDFKGSISAYLDDILQGEWNINVTSKLFKVQPTIKRCFTPMDVVLYRARIGHAYFTNGCLLRWELRPMCCNTRLSVRHALLGCAKYAHIRRNFLCWLGHFFLILKRKNKKGRLAQGIFGISISEFCKNNCMANSTRKCLL